jgi:hypothetical protein
MKWPLYVSILLLILAFATASETRAQEAIPRFERSKCPIEVPSEASIECGTLIAPENYDNPDGRTVRLPVIILHSRQANPSEEALLFTEGGPGFSSLGSVGWLASTSFGNDRDIIVLEQRGNKFAEPIPPARKPTLTWKGNFTTWSASLTTHRLNSRWGFPRAQGSLLSRSAAKP